MSEIDTEFDLEIPDELITLKERAILMGLSFHPSIGVDKLREKVAAASVVAKPEVIAPVAIPENEETDVQFRHRKKFEANELMRIRVSCMNPAKKEWDGEIFTAGNSLVGSFSKFIPFVDAEDGWHVPRIIYNQIVQRQCQVFVTTRDVRGNSTRKGKLIKEFAVEVLPALTSQELTELARRQSMAKATD
jgi:hypothetical protein